jgi:hypothetical protein
MVNLNNTVFARNLARRQQRIAEDKEQNRARMKDAVDELVRQRDEKARQHQLDTKREEMNRRTLMDLAKMEGEARAQLGEPMREEDDALVGTGRQTGRSIGALKAAIRAKEEERRKRLEEARIGYMESQGGLMRARAANAGEDKPGKPMSQLDRMRPFSSMARRIQTNLGMGEKIDPKIVMQLETDPEKRDAIRQMRVWDEMAALNAVGKIPDEMVPVIMPLLLRARSEAQMRQIIAKLKIPGVSPEAPAPVPGALSPGEQGPPVEGDTPEHRQDVMRYMQESGGLAPQDVPYGDEGLGAFDFDMGEALNLGNLETDVDALINKR